MLDGLHTSMGIDEVARGVSPSVTANNVILSGCNGRKQCCEAKGDRCSGEKGVEEREGLHLDLRARGRVER